MRISLHSNFLWFPKPSNPRRSIQLTERRGGNAYLPTVWLASCRIRLNCFFILYFSALTPTAKKTPHISENKGPYSGAAHEKNPPCRNPSPSLQMETRTEKCERHIFNAFSCTYGYSLWGDAGAILRCGWSDSITTRSRCTLLHCGKSSSD